MTRAARLDSTQRAIVAALRAAGCTVCVLSPGRSGDAAGLPDLLVGVRGQTVLVEAKGPRGRLNEAQEAWRARWRGGPYIVARTAHEALVACGLIAAERSA